MATIKRLPDSVRTNLRSGIILFDLTRVVEELVFNSIDAKATKVSVFVGVATCYVKVVDDGSGVSRDGLELLGERYATSKLRNMADIDVNGVSFGFRGEVLASVSDVAVLEIVTRAYGKPNGYRKVIKGSKCLHLGIDNDRKDIGTTVVVRDLFYNQPVRRKYMQASPKKVLHTVKECIHRIALVYPMVSFKIVDNESDDEILCSHSSTSPMSRLMSSFGIEDSISLHELNAKDGIIKLSGYISAPCGCFSSKAFQYVYINSRFVCKSPVHKLMNMLAAKFEALDQLEPNSTSQKGKRSRFQAYPTFLLNISCPRSLYDLTFEPSKTYADVKDWEPILTFIKKTIQHIWTKDIASEESFSNSAGKLVKDGIFKDEYNVSFMKEDVFDEDFPRREKKCKIRDDQEGEYSNQPTEMEFVSHIDYSIQLRDRRFLLSDSSVLATETSNNHDRKKLSSQWENGSALSFDFSDRLEPSKGIMKPFLQSCSSRESLTLDGDLFTSKDEFELSIHGPSTKQKHLLPGEDILKAGIGLQCLDEILSVHNVPMKRSGISVDSDIFLKASMEPFRSGRCGLLAVENDLLSNSAAQIENTGSDALFQTHSWDLKMFPEEDPLEGISRFSNFRHFSTTTENYTSFENYNDASGGCKFLERNNLEDKFLEENSDISFDNANWYFPESFGDRYINTERQKDQSRHHVIKERSKRSHSAPPFHKQRMKFISLSCNQMVNARNPTTQTFHSPAAAELKQLQSSRVCDEYLEYRFATNLGFDARPYAGKKPAAIMDTEELQNEREIEQFNFSLSPSNVPVEDEELQNEEELEQFKFSRPPSNMPVKGLVTRDIQDSTSCGTKWHVHFSETLSSNCSTDAHDQDNILSISSGFLHLSADSLVPENINKNFLKDARVLQQVDKKFIPVVAGRTLVLIDQHAADERIRLEELRGKVLSGEARTISYLDTEQEMILPEIGYQLLHNYATQVKDWGWICNIHSQGSKSFKKSLSLLHRQPNVVTLVAVPCILDVNLSDTDLVEFLQQLADTDGSSTIPPSVIRLLNSKACRGAIMFGDCLLPSECSLIVEELKQTKLCFQCAHGRPTTAPIVNLEALHKEIAKLQATDIKPWHGLRRHEPSLERAAQRLRASRG